MVQRLMVIDKPLAGLAQEEPRQQAIMQTAEWFRSYGVTPRSPLIGACVGAVVGATMFGGAVKGLIVGALIDMAVSYVQRT